MGWFFQQDTSRTQLIADRTAPWENEEYHTTVLKYCLRKEDDVECLWKVTQRLQKKTGKVERYIEVDLIKKSSDDWGWGYKDMTEFEGPYYFSCPISYLKLAGKTTDPGALKWREKLLDFNRKVF